MRVRTASVVLFVLVVSALCSAAEGELKLHGIFGDGMVVQRGEGIPVWGTASPGADVAVTLGEGRAEATADAEGAWSVELPAMAAGGPHELTITVGAETHTITNVAVGEVWVCSGQSNMAFALSGAANGQQAVAEADFPMMRRFRVANTVAGKPQANVPGKWAVVHPSTVSGWQGISAVAYFFGRKLHRDLDVPVGLIQTAWGGTPAESWTPREHMAADEGLKGSVDSWDGTIARSDQQVDAYMAKVEQWRKDSAAAEAEGRPVSEPPKFDDKRRSPRRATGLYNAMIAPLTRVPVRGAIWYQGESNAGRKPDYSNLFQTMITSWREAWGRPEMPFLFVQLADFNPTDQFNTWPYLREDQADALELPNTGMAVTIDIGNPTDIHPRNKLDVGERLALAAEAIAYGMDVVYSGPTYESMVLEGNAIRVRFTHVGGGLVSSTDALKGFELAGTEDDFVPATAVIQGDSVLLTTDAAGQPVHVRYAWRNVPDCSLFNREGLPASPFRTDARPAPWEAAQQ